MNEKQTECDHDVFVKGECEDCGKTCDHPIYEHGACLYCGQIHPSNFGRVS